MKKTVIILAFLLMFFVGGSGYAQFQVGPLIGGTLSGVNIKPDAAGVHVNNVTGYTAGIQIIYNFTPMFGVQLEPTYMERGASVHTAQTDVALILEIEQTVVTNYIDVPLLFRVSFEGDFIKPYLLAGANIAFPVGDSKVKIDKVTANGQDFLWIVPSEEREQELPTNNVDYGLNFGAGLSFPVGVFDIFFQAQYNLGLSNLSEESAEQQELKHRGIQLKTGLLFTL
jgi:hypothetical protein